MANFMKTHYFYGHFQYSYVTNDQKVPSLALVNQEEISLELQVELAQGSGKRSPSITLLMIVHVDVLLLW